jgi:hypothetical protein
MVLLLKNVSGERTMVLLEDDGSGVENCFKYFGNSAEVEKFQLMREWFLYQIMVLVLEHVDSDDR